MQSNEILWMDWFTPERESQVNECFASNLEVLRLSGALTKVLREWLREEMARDVEAWPEEADDLKEHLDQWWDLQKKAPPKDQDEERENYLKRNHMDTGLLKKKLRVELALKKWAIDNWTASVPQMFLDSKDLFDEVSFNMMRLPAAEKNLANELYHRLKAGESKFEELAMSYGHGPERLPGGSHNQMTLNMPQPKLSARLKALRPGELSLPFIVAEWVLIIEMKSTKPAELNDEISNLLIERAMDKFIKFGSRKIGEALCELQGSNPLISQGV